MWRDIELTEFSRLMQEGKEKEAADLLEKGNRRMAWMTYTPIFIFFMFALVKIISDYHIPILSELAAFNHQ